MKKKRKERLCRWKELSHYKPSQTNGIRDHKVAEAKVMYLLSILSPRKMLSYEDFVHPYICPLHIFPTPPRATPAVAAHLRPRVQCHQLHVKPQGLVVRHPWWWGHLTAGVCVSIGGLHHQHLTVTLLHACSQVNRSSVSCIDLKSVLDGTNQGPESR